MSLKKIMWRMEQLANERMHTIDGQVNLELH